MIYRLLNIAIALIACCAIQAQDIHFSQFYFAPALYNPSLTGAFNGDYRFQGNQRTQWRSVTTPYSTFGLAADGRRIINDNMHAGVSFFTDKAGDSKLSTTTFNISGAYEKLVQNRSFFTAGVMIGVTRQNIDYSELNFDTQWTGTFFNPELSTNEAFAQDAQTWMNLSLGGTFFHQLDNDIQLKAGIAAHNLLAPDQSYFSIEDVQLNPRVSFQGHCTSPKINDAWIIEGNLLYQIQGTFNEFLIGGMAKNVLEDSGGLYRTIFAGVYGRTRDAGYILAGLDYDNLRVGISYDINVSNLRPASNARGGFEFSVHYILRKFRPYKVEGNKCPEYL